MDSCKCIPNIRWLIAEGIKLILVVLITEYVFFDSIYYLAIGLLPAGIILFHDLENYRRSNSKRFCDEFREAMEVVSSRLEAGYSLEHAFTLATGEIDKRYGGRAILQRELNYIKHGLECNEDITVLLMNFANRSGNCDVRELAMIISAAKRYGGNMISLICRYNKILIEKEEVNQEIETIVAGKKLEGKIMTLAPIGIILYMKLTNGEYISILYSTLFGRIVMTIGLIITIVCWLIMNKIVRIEV